MSGEERKPHAVSVSIESPTQRTWAWRVTVGDGEECGYAFDYACGYENACRNIKCALRQLGVEV